MINKIHNEDCLATMARMDDNSIDCCITSPPYWKLRDYGVEGQLGLESTPEKYVQKMVQIFAEIRRVLKKDGTLFLNIGDSYFGSGGAHKENHANPGLSKSFERGGVPHEVLCGTFDKEPEDYQDHGCLCGNLCGVCREVYQSRRFHNDGLLVSMLIASLSLPNPVHKESLNDHFPTLDFSLLENHITNAIRGQGHFLNPSDELFDAFQGSMSPESFELLLAECLRRHDFSLCLLCGRSSISGGQEFLHRSGCICDKDRTLSFSGHHNSGSNHNVYPYPNITIPYHNVNLKPKDLVGIPWRVAFALQADGWYLRSDIIWSKPNPMPESVTDRPTKAHEYIFLMSKNAKYYYDADAIREEHSQASQERMRYPVLAKGGKCESAQGDKFIASQLSSQTRADGTPKMQYNPSGRNKRTVWHVATQPYSEAHFATYPEKLIEPCVLAGCPKEVCSKCGKPVERVVEKVQIERNDVYAGSKFAKKEENYSHKRLQKMVVAGRAAGLPHDNPMIPSKTIGFVPSYSCGADTIPGVIYDPFGGAGTTALVALRAERNFILSEINAEYVKIAENRLKLLLQQYKFDF